MTNLTQSQSPIVDVVVPLFNEASTIRDLCAALSQQRGRPYRVFLVDNGSTDATVSIAQQYFEVYSCQTPGSYVTRNHGAALGRAPYIAFTDGDCVPVPGWLEELCAELDRGADVVGGITRADARSHLGCSRFGRNLLIYRVEYYGGAYIRMDAHGLECSFPSCNVAYRRSVFEALGGFSMTTGADVALSNRAAQAGYACQMAPKALVSHYAASSVMEIWQKFFFYAAQRDVSCLQAIAALTLLTIFPVTIAVQFLVVYCRRQTRARTVNIPLSYFALFESLRLLLTLGGLVYYRFRSPTRVY